MSTETTPLPTIDDLLRRHAENVELGKQYKLNHYRTDVGNSQRLVDAFGDRLRFDHTRGSWLYWDETRWKPDARSVAMYLARLVARSIHAEATRVDDSNERKALGRWAEQSETVSRIRAMIDLAKADPIIASESTAFDADPDILNVGNGIVDLKSGELRNHDPEAMCSRIAPVNYRPELLERDADGVPRFVSEAPTFAKFVAEIMCGRKDAVEYLQRLFGYGATGHASEQILAIAVGIGENGKGAMFRAVKHALGDYAQTAPPELVVDDGKRGGASPEIARLRAVRLLEIEETDDGDRLHEARVKWLTGEDTLVARHLFAEYFEFRPNFTPLLVTNHRPRVATGGRATWRRLRVIPFDFVVTERDDRLEQKLEAESEAVLAWIVEGARLWYQHGLPRSETVDKASAAYQKEEDQIAPFIDDCTITVGSEHRTKLYKAYLRWCESESEKPMSAKRFNSALRERGFEEVAERTYGNIQLKNEWKP